VEIESRKAAAHMGRRRNPSPAWACVPRLSLHEESRARRRRYHGVLVNTVQDNFDWRSIMERIKQVAGLSWVGAVVAVVAAMLASMVSFGFVVAVYAASSGELQVAIAKARGVSAPASAVVAAPRKPRSG
jgi:hypothetical protein